MKRIILIFISIFLNIFLTGMLVIEKCGEKKQESAEVKEMERGDNLSEWQMFTLALMKVESEFRNDAISSAGARGYFQMTPIYVKEVNRVHGTSYTFADVTDFDKAYEIFDLMQRAHNPEYDMKKALELHNGKHEWYNRRVFKAMNELKTYEEIRSKIKTYEEIQNNI